MIKRDITSYIDRGIDLAEKGSYDEAIKEFDNAVELEPNFARAYYNTPCCRIYSLPTLGELYSRMQAVGAFLFARQAVAT